MPCEAWVPVPGESMALSIEKQQIVVRTPEKGDPVRVLLIDESVIALQGLRAVLSTCERIILVGTACTEVDAHAAVQACQPNVVVLEMLFGRMSGINICRTIRQAHPNIAVLFFTAKDDASLLRSAIDAGAQGYLLKSASTEALLKCIEAVAIGKAVVDPYLTHLVLTWMRIGMGEVPRHSSGGLSVDDLRLLSCVASGKTDRQIAQELIVDRRVIVSHLHRLYRRLGITRRAEAVRHFLEYEHELRPKQRRVERFAVPPIRDGEGRQRADHAEQWTDGHSAMGGSIVSVT